MKFKVICVLKSSKSNIIAEGLDFIIYNVLLSDNVEIDGESKEHEFIIVVNKRGQLTVLCVK